MPENRSLFVLVSQQALALATVGAVAASAIGVVELEIVPPAGTRAVQAVVPSTDALTSAAPVKPKVRNVPLDGGTSSAPSRLRPKSPTGGDAPQEDRKKGTPEATVVSRAEKVTGYATVGVTWDAGQHFTSEQIHTSVRTLKGGVWSDWQPMHYDADHEPDPAEEGSTDRKPVKDGTDAVVVGDVDEVQTRTVTTTGVSPRGLSLAVIDPGTSVEVKREKPAIDTATLSSATLSSATLGSATVSGGAQLSAGKLSAPRPKIFSRAQWGADERLRDPGSLHYGEIHAGFVHHTVNANDYSRDQVPSIIRGIYAYHTQSRGWSDIGYNFVVDRFGRIWEGRYGGVDRAVVGAHTLGYNDDSFAMSAIGNFEIAHPTKAMIKAYAALFAWKLGMAGVAADDTKVYVTSRYFQAINGHRDAGQTACPGRYLYEKIPQIRRLAARLQRGDTQPPPPPPPPPAPSAGKALNANLSGDSWPDLVVRDQATQHAVIVRTGGQTSFLPATTAADDWSGKDLVVATGDLDGDGQGDLLARSGLGKPAALYTGNGSGFDATGTSFARFGVVDQLTGVGDLDGDGNADLVGRRADSKRLMLFRGDGKGGFLDNRSLSADWGAYDLTAGVNDFDGDGHPDLVARAGRTLYLVPGAGRTLGKRVALDGSWGGFDVITGRGDASGDGTPDLVTRSAKTGLTFVYPGDGKGGVGPRIGSWDRFGGLRWLALGGQLNGSGKADLVGIDRTSGQLQVFADSGRRNLGRRIDTGSRLTGIDLLLNVGDWNGDGRGDVMTRDASSGFMQFRAGLKGNRLADPVNAGGRRWAERSLVAPVGDVSGDGAPDLVARTKNGTFRIYPGNGKTGFTKSFQAHPPTSASGQLTLGMWDDDKLPDSAVRRSGALWVWSSAAKEFTKVGDGLRRYDWLLGLGDLNGDGRADVVGRLRSNGSLYLLPGRGSGLGPRQLIGPGFDAYDLGG